MGTFTGRPGICDECKQMVSHRYAVRGWNCTYHLCQRCADNYLDAQQAVEEDIIRHDMFTDHRRVPFGGSEGI